MKITAENTIEVLRKHLLVDGLDLVLDLKNSRGSRIVDARTGRSFLDFFTFFASSPIGMNHPKLTTPEFREKLADVAVNKPSNSDICSVPMAEFVDTFSRVGIPDYLPHLFLISGGSLAVENALKTAFDWKIRRNFEKGATSELGGKVIYLKDAFHGRSGYTLSMTNTFYKHKTQYFPKFDWYRVDNPYIRFPIDADRLESLLLSEQASLAQVKSAILEDGKNIAAILLEPIQAEGGDRHFRPEYLKALKQIADENDIVFILDEVQTGVGLTGSFWAHQALDVRPDIIAFGKKMQVCGILAGPKIDQVERNVFRESSRINSTFGGNLVDMVRAERYLTVIEEEGLVENAGVQGGYLLKGLFGLQQKFEGLITNCRGRGLMCAFDLPNTGIRDQLVRDAFDNNLLILKCGERTIRFRPALNIDRDEIDECLETLEKAFRVTMKTSTMKAEPKGASVQTV